MLRYRTINNTVTPFKLPTAYNAPGQKNISDEDDKEKICLDTKTANVKDYTVVQLQEVAQGWMRYIRKTIKQKQDAVSILTILILISSILHFFFYSILISKIKVYLKLYKD